MICKLKHSHCNCLRRQKNRFESLIERKIQEYLDENAEIEKRKLNLIFHGLLPEPPQETTGGDGDSRPTTDDEKKRHDMKKLTELKDADKKLTVKENDVESIFRIGKRIDGKPRMVCVKLKSHDVRKSLLACAKRLRESTKPWLKKVFINPDLTKRQRDRNQEARNELSRKKENGEDNLMIRNFQVVKRSHPQATAASVRSA